MSIGTWAAAAEVRLRSSAACTTAVVRLADVAEVFADDQRLAAALAEIPLCPAPAAGKQRSLSQQDVRQLLVLSGVEAAATRLTGSETVTVVGEGVRSSSLPKRPLVASGVRQAVFESDVDPANKRARARPAPVIASVPASDTTNEAPARPLVERGAAVTVTARAAGVTITTSGKTLEPGAAGETVQIELADSKQHIWARVTGPQMVEVSAAEGASSAPAAISRPTASKYASP